MNAIKIILNPYSGRHKSAKYDHKIRQLLMQAKIDFKIAYTQKTGHGIELARQAKLEGYKVIVAAGGDGTINEVVNGLAQVTQPGNSIGTLGILPMGSGNDLASVLGYSNDLKQAIQTIAKGRTRQIDLGYSKWRSGNQEYQRYFDNNLGLGFEAQVTQESQKIKYLRGILIYLFATFKALRHYQTSEMNLEWTLSTGESYKLTKKLLMVSIGNSCRNGGGFYITPQALVDDGLLNAAVIDGLPWTEILSLLPKLIKGTHIQKPYLKMLEFNQIKIACLTPVPVHLDGELITTDATDLQVEVQPKKLEVIVA